MPNEESPLAAALHKAEQALTDYYSLSELRAALAQADRVVRESARPPELPIRMWMLVLETAGACGGGKSEDDLNRFQDLAAATEPISGADRSFIVAAGYAVGMLERAKRTDDAKNLASRAIARLAKLDRETPLILLALWRIESFIGRADPERMPGLLDERVRLSTLSGDAKQARQSKVALALHFEQTVRDPARAVAAWRRVVEDWESAGETAPGTMYVHHLASLAEALHSMGNDAEALETYDKIEAKSPDLASRERVGILWAKAAALLGVKRTEEAEKVYLSILELDRSANLLGPAGQRDVWLELSRVQLVLGRTNYALQSATNGSQLCGDDQACSASFLSVRAQAHEALGAIDDADKAWTLCADLMSKTVGDQNPDTQFVRDRLRQLREKKKSTS